MYRGEAIRRKEAIDMAERKSTQKLSVEQAVQRMEEIQEIIQKGEISLKESVALFEEAAKLYKLCSESLTALEDRVKILSKASDGGLEAVPFDIDE